MSFAVQLACTNFARSLRFYSDVLGFTTMRFEPEARRAELERDDVQIELLEGTGEEIAPPEYPFGRGITLILWSRDVQSVYAGVLAYGARLRAPLHEVCREEEGLRTAHMRFEVIDPDGYRLRFCQAMALE